MTRTVAVSNQKGGVAKTTTVASLGVALAERGCRVLLIDLDPQACLTFSLGYDPEELSVSVADLLGAGRAASPSTAAVILAAEEGVDLLPATIELARAEAALLTRTGRELVLRAVLDSTTENYDWVLIDCPPSLGVLTVNALSAATEVLVPLQCETLSHRGLGQLLDTVHDVRSLLNPRLTMLGVLPTQYDARQTHARAVLADVSERYSLPVLEPAIPKTVRFAEAPALGRSVLATAGRSRGAQAYRALAARLDGPSGAAVRRRGDSA